LGLGSLDQFSAPEYSEVNICIHGGSMHTQGIIVGCDKNQEWLLPWWWDHYSRHNSFPVAFADFGMSEKALSWCQERGVSLTLPAIKILHENEVSPADKKQLEARYGPGIWRYRSAWFKKPLALLHSPFSTGLWIDLDCRITGSLEALFYSLLPGVAIALVKEPEFIQNYDLENGYLLPGEVNYNSGVIVFRQNAEILHQWMEETISNNGNYPGDQQALCRSIYLHRPILFELPSLWNWLLLLGPNPEALINHYTGDRKLMILKEIHPSAAPLIEASFTFPVNFRPAARHPSVAPFSSSIAPSAMDSSKVATSGASRLAEILTVKANEALIESMNDKEKHK
jgi:hypothetical protein